MRWLPTLVVIALPALAAAKPKVAIAPLDGDEDNKIADLVVNAADDHAKVIRPERVSKAMETLSLTTFNGKAVKKLRVNLEVDVVIHGSVDKAGAKRKLELTIAGKGKHKATLAVTFKSTKTLKKDLSPELRKKIEEAMGGDEDPDDDDAPPKQHEDDPPKKHEAAPPPKPHADEDRPKQHADDDRPKHRVADDDTSVRKRHGDDDDDDRPHRKKHKHGRDPLTQAAVWLAAGAEVGRRSLTWHTGSDAPPPKVGTAAAAGRLDAEVYPLAFDSLQGAAALGVYGELSHTVGLSIDAPGSTNNVSIKDGHYAIGARYRVVFGSSSVAFGASYWRRYYIAEQPMAAPIIDMPSVDYTAVAPGALARFAASPTVAAFASLDIPLVLKSGEIQSSTSYGRGTVIAFDLRAGAQISLGPHYALALAGELDQVGISFEGATNSKAQVRSVSGSVDRTLAITATLGLFY